jgi:pimeloyl-ACP methyl ester carboxylesterase
LHLVDLPGFGVMRRLHRRFALAGAAEWLRAWMDAVGLERTHLLGHSMGGLIAVRFAIAWPHAIDRLALVAPAGLPTGRSLARHVIGVPMMWRHVTLTSLRLLAPDTLRNPPRLILRVAREILVEDVGAALGRIAAPTLVVWGSADPLVPPAHAALFRAAIPDARLVVVSGAGHLPMVTHPSPFTAAIVAFLRGDPVGE